MALMDMDYRLKWQIGQEFSIDVFDLSLWQLTTNVLCHHLDSMYAWYQFVDEGLGGFSKMVITFNHVGGSLNISMDTTGDVLMIPSFRIWVICCMLSTFCVSSQIVANLSESSLLFSQYIFRLCYSRLLSLYSFLSLSFLFTFFILVCYCSMWLFFSQGTS